jgi:hypothetical protein
MRARPLAALSLACALLPAAAGARRNHRARFEPTDLEMAEPGELDLNIESGLLRDGASWRVYAPDVELDLGLTRDVELDLDGSFALASPGTEALTPLTPSPDNLWISLKIGLIGDRHRQREAWGLGFQAGPRVAVAPGFEGLGAEALVLVARHQGRVHLAANLGGYIEPRNPATATTQRAAIAALDLAVELDATSTWQLHAELYGVLATDSDAHEAGASVGVEWAASPNLSLSGTVLAGWSNGGPAVGALIGFSPSFQLWR